MKYFTPELYGRGQSSDRRVQNEVDELWEKQVDLYDEHLQRISPHLPEQVRRYVEETYLHDARLSSIVRRGDDLLLTLHPDGFPRDVVLLRYQLAGEPVILKNVLAPEHCSTGTQFMYNEFDVVHEDGGTLFTESILFSDGWELQLKYRDVEVALAQAIYPVPQTPTLAQSA